MPIVTVFSSDFCHADEVVGMILDRVGGRLVADADILAAAAELSGLGAQSLARAFKVRTSVFNRFTHEKERARAWLKLALAEMLQSGDLLVHGCVSLLIPAEVENVLRVCLIADADYRVSQAASQRGISQEEARAVVQDEELQRMTWVEAVRGERDPWKPELYDLILPMDKQSPIDAASMITQYLGKDVLHAAQGARQQLRDFLLAAHVEAELAREGHAMEVAVTDGRAVITVNGSVSQPARLMEEAKAIASRVDGLRAVEITIYHDRSNAVAYHRFDARAPSKVLLVDDEREFVETLSERLDMRGIGSAVAYDGESALNLVHKDEPEVMILDLRMPGIDGMEVLRRVKQTSPDIEVIILSGHGSEVDRKACMDLGAFACMNKPVDIGVLSETMRKAYESMCRKHLAQSRQ